MQGGFPVLEKTSTTTKATPQRLYQNASQYHLNSLSLSPAGDTFLIADDFSVSQFWVEDHHNGFQLISNQFGLDCKLNTITYACFHPQDANLVLTGYSTGMVKLYDLR